MKVFSIVNDIIPDMMASCSLPENTKNNDLYLVRRRLGKTNLITSASYLDTNSRVKCSMHSSPNIVTAQRVYPYILSQVIIEAALRPLTEPFRDLLLRSAQLNSWLNIQAREAYQRTPHPLLSLPGSFLVSFHFYAGMINDLGASHYKSALTTSYRENSCTDIFMPNLNHHSRSLPLDAKLVGALILDISLCAETWMLTPPWRC